MDAAFLQSQALFGGISHQGITKVIPFLQEHTFQPGEYIIKENERGKDMYFLVEGNVEVLKEVKGDDGTVTEKPLTTLKVGDVFGEMEVLDILPRSASVRAIDNAKVMSLSNSHLYELYKLDLEVFTMIVMNLARELSRRLRAMDDKVTV